jgi:hypothetical protein
MLQISSPRCDRPLLRQAISTWTGCGERLAPRRATEGYTAEPAAPARLVFQAYHNLSRSYGLPPPDASTRSLRMPTEQGRSPTQSVVGFHEGSQKARVG